MLKPLSNKIKTLFNLIKMNRKNKDMIADRGRVKFKKWMFQKNHMMLGIQKAENSQFKKILHSCKNTWFQMLFGCFGCTDFKMFLHN